jgi:hypothetical protein
MIDDVLTTIHRAAIAALKGAPMVAAFAPWSVEVYEILPGRTAGLEGSQAYPAIELPSMTSNELEPVGEEDDCIDDPAEVLFDVHVYSRQHADGSGGPPEARKILAAARKVLNALTIPPETGYRIVLCERQTARHFTDGDKLTAHAVGSHRLLVEPLEV